MSTTSTTRPSSRSSRRCGSGGLAAAIGAHTGIATPPVWRFGTPDQHERFLVPAIRGEKIAALGITEPGAGSDVASIRTTARACPGGDEPDVLAELDRAARDARLGPIGGGTDEIMKEILSKGMGL